MDEEVFVLPSSNTVTIALSRSSCRTIAEPMKPAPPVTSTRLFVQQQTSSDTFAHPSFALVTSIWMTCISAGALIQRLLLH